MLPFQFIHCDETFFSAMNFSRQYPWLVVPSIESSTSPYQVLEAARSNPSHINRIARQGVIGHMARRFAYYIESIKRERNPLAGIPTSAQAFFTWPVQCRACFTISSLSTYIEGTARLLVEPNYTWHLCAGCQQIFWTPEVAHFYATHLKGYNSTERVFAGWDPAKVWADILDKRITLDALHTAHAISPATFTDAIFDHGGVVPLESSALWQTLAGSDMSTHEYTGVLHGNRSNDDFWPQDNVKLIAQADRLRQILLTPKYSEGKLVK